MIIKICGIQNEETLKCCEENGVNFFGMIFYPKSPRNISFKKASILQNISAGLNISGVGVFVNKDINELEDIIKNLRLRFIQLHGSEDEKYIESLKKKCPTLVKRGTIKEYMNKLSPNELMHLLIS